MFKNKNLTELRQPEIAFFAEERRVFKAGPEKPSAAPVEIPEAEIEKRKEKGTEFTGDMVKDIKRFAREIYKENPALAAEKATDWARSWREDMDARSNLGTAEYKGNVEKYINGTLKKLKCDKITLEKDSSDSKEYFKYWSGNQDLGLKSELRPSRGAPISAETTPPKPAEAAPKKPAEPAPAKPVETTEVITAKPAEQKAGIRAVDNMAETEEMAKAAKEIQGQKIRTEVFRKEGALSGTVKFKDWEHYLNTKISDIFPDAREGDKVQILRRDTQTPILAEYDGAGWKYTDGKKSANRVKIENGDRLVLTRAEEKGPTPPEGIVSAGYLRIDKAASWKEIAKTIMTTGTVPKGEKYETSTTPTEKPAANSPQSLLKELGYDPANEADVTAYAKILEETNKNDKLNVWAVIPKEKNKRATEAVSEKEKAAIKKEAAKRSIETVEQRSNREDRIFAKHFRNLENNEAYDLQPKMAEIVNNDELWNYYWTKGNLTGKGQILRGFEMMKVEPTKVRSVLLDAIQQGSNKTIDFEDLLDAFDNKKINVFVTVDGKRGSHKAFTKEYVFYQTAYRIEKGERVNKAQREFYEDNKSDFLKKGLDVSNRYNELNDIMRGSSMVMEGLSGMIPTMEVSEAKQSVKERKEEKAEAKLEKRSELLPTKSGKEEAFLQSFFHPSKAQGMEDITEAESIEDEKKSDFENLFSEAEAYRMIRFNSASESNPHKIDRSRMITEMNALVLEALMDFRTQYLLLNNPDASAEAKEQAKQYLDAKRQRYFGETSDNVLRLNSQDFMPRIMKIYAGIPADLNINQERLPYIRNMLQDGFALQRTRAEGKVEKAEAPKEWISYGDILKDAKNPATREIVTKLMEQKKFRDLSPDQQKKAVKDIDATLSKKNDFERSKLFDINAAVNTNTGDWSIGLSKEVVKIPGVDMDLSLGFAVNPKTNKVLIGVLLGKQVELSKQWSANVAAAAGVEVTNPKIIAGISGGFTWMSEGSPDSPWRDKVPFGAGFGSSISFNLTDIYLGPYIYGGYGQEKDYQNQQRQLYTREYLSNRLDTVEGAAGSKEKAQAIRQMPRGVGEFMTEVQYNMHWTDAQMVKFYEKNIKGGLEKIAFDKAYENASGISEWGIGGTIDPVKLTLLAASLVALGPAVTGALTIGLYGRLGIIVGSTIKVKREASNMKDQQIESENRMIREIETTYPGVKIEMEAAKFEDMDRVTSREFAGSDMQRILGVKESDKAKKAKHNEFNEFSPAESKEFKELQNQFAKNHLELSIDAETKMYVIRPAMIESYRMYMDPQMKQGNGLILTDKKILVAGSENLSNLHIKRFDSFYPGEVDGAVQYTVITISDNPERTIGEISENNAYIENIYDREGDGYKGRQKVGRQENILTMAEYKALSPDKRRRFATSEQRSAAAVERRNRTESEKANSEMTSRALALGVKLEENIDLSGLKMSAEEFIKSPKYRVRYRQLTTNATREMIQELDEDIKKENPEISQDQLILYKERLFHLSMSEAKVSVENRLQWAEKVIYKPFFEERLAKMREAGATINEGITADSLAISFIAGVRARLRENPVALGAGESIFTAVGTEHVKGTRRIYASTGQDPEENLFREGFDYSDFLSAKGSKLSEEQRTIARILLDEHSELPKENEAFLRSRLAKKLFYLGSDEASNPVINVLGKDKFEKLINAYTAIEKDQTSPTDATDAIQSFRELCEKIRDAQLGNGIPVSIDGKLQQAVLIGNYCFVIGTKLESGVYEECKNPSSLYNETINVFDRSVYEAALAAPRATIGSGAGDVVVLESRSASVTSLGLNAIGIRSFALANEKKPATTTNNNNPTGGESSETSQATKPKVDDTQAPKSGSASE
jgi:hypothetical protein